MTWRRIIVAASGFPKCRQQAPLLLCSQPSDGPSGARAVTQGTRRNGARWNSKGVPVLYCATSESLAMLELRVHAPHPYPRTRLRFIIEVPDDAVEEAPVAELPRGWNELPPSPASKRFGDEWVAAPQLHIVARTLASVVSRPSFSAPA